MYKALHIEDELSQYFSIKSDVQGFKNMYSLVITTFLSDFVILIAFGGSFGIFIIYSLYLLCKSPDDFQYNPLEVEVPWKCLLTFCMYSMLFPLCCLANHLNYIIIAFIHNLYHATSVAIVYGVIIIFLSVMLNRIPVFFKKWMEDMTGRLMLIILVVKIIVVVVLLGYVIIDIIVYFFIPIERAFEDAANHFISVYSTTVVFFTGLVAFFFIRKSFKSQIHIFTKAVDDFFNENEENNNILEINRDNWKKLCTDKKDIKVAKELLKRIN